MQVCNKRYILAMTVLVSSLLVMAGCRPNEIKNQVGKEYDTIKSVKLDEDINNLLGSVGVEKYFVFDFELTDTEERKADLWVDYYEYGEYINKIAGGGFSFGDQENDKSGRLIMAINDMPNDVDQREFVVSMMDNNGFSSGSIAVPKRERDIFSTWKTIDKANLSLNRTINLAVIVEDRDGDKIDINEDIFNDNEEALNEILKNDYVYILRCIFK